MLGPIILVTIILGLLLVVVASACCHSSFSSTAEEYFKNKEYEETFNKAFLDREMISKISDEEYRILKNIKENHNEIYMKLLRKYKISNFKVMYVDLEYSSNYAFIKLVKGRKNGKVL